MLLQFVVSFGFILPVNAPQNMIAYGTGTFDARDFIHRLRHRWWPPRFWLSSR